MDRSPLETSLTAAGVAHLLDPANANLQAQLGVFDTSIDYAPQAVVDVQHVEDVAIAVSLAQREGVQVSTLGTGHGFLHAVTGGILLATRGLAGVDVDAEKQTARVFAGTKWDAVVAAAAPYGLAGLCGSAPGVGVTGYLMGGGIGPLARTYGYSSDYVRSIEIVTPADGPITVSPTEHPELFWALRGGKGGFGVVTSIEIDLLPVSTVYGGGIYFSADDAPAVLREFGPWSSELPESATTSIALLRLPDAPQLPAELRGKYVAHLRFASVEEEGAASRLLAPMRAIGTPVVDLVAELPYSGIGSIHGDPTEPMRVHSGGATLTDFNSDVAGELLAVAGPDVEVPISAIEIRALGGAAEREPDVASAVGGRSAAFNLFASGAPLPPDAQPAVTAALDAVLGAVAPWRGEQNLINFVGAANTDGDVARSWSIDQNKRLDAARKLADPDGIFPFAGHGRLDD